LRTCRERDVPGASQAPCSSNATPRESVRSPWGSRRLDAPAERRCKAGSMRRVSQTWEDWLHDHHPRFTPDAHPGRHVPEAEPQTIHHFLLPSRILHLWSLQHCVPRMPAVPSPHGNARPPERGPPLFHRREGRKSERLVGLWAGALGRYGERWGTPGTGSARSLPRSPQPHAALGPLYSRAVETQETLGYCPVLHAKARSRAECRAGGHPAPSFQSSSHPVRRKPPSLTAPIPCVRHYVAPYPPSHTHIIQYVLS
jgi:hypothetical protein